VLAESPQNESVGTMGGGCLGGLTPPHPLPQGWLLPCASNKLPCLCDISEGEGWALQGTILPLQGSAPLPQSCIKRRKFQSTVPDLGVYLICASVLVSQDGCLQQLFTLAWGSTTPEWEEMYFVKLHVRGEEKQTTQTPVPPGYKQICCWKLTALNLSGKSTSASASTLGRSHAAACPFQLCSLQEPSPTGLNRFAALSLPSKSSAS